MKKVLMKIYKKHSEINQETYSLKQIVPAVLYKESKVLKQDYSEKEIQATDKVEVFRKLSLTGNESVKIDNKTYTIIKVYHGKLMRCLSIYLQECAGD